MKVLREVSSNIYDAEERAEERWEELFEKARNTGWFEKAVEEVKEQIAEGEVSSLEELL